MSHLVEHGGAELPLVAAAEVARGDVDLPRRWPPPLVVLAGHRPGQDVLDCRLGRV